MARAVESLPAFEQVVDRYTQPLWRYGLQLTGSRETAQKILLACFKELFKRRRESWPAKAVSLWLYRQATQLAFQGRDTTQREALAKLKQAQPQAFDFSRRQQRLQAALLSLDRPRRALLALTLLEGFPYAKAASILETDEETVKREAVLAYQQLKGSLGEKFF